MTQASMAEMYQRTPEHFLDHKMTPIESVHEIKSAVIELQEYLCSKDRFVSKRAQVKYEQWVDRFFRENKNYVKSEQKRQCLDDSKYFLKIMNAAIEYHYEADTLG